MEQSNQTSLSHKNRAYCKNQLTQLENDKIRYEWPRHGTENLIKRSRKILQCTSPVLLKQTLKNFTLTSVRTGITATVGSLRLENFEYVKKKILKWLKYR